MIPNVDDEVRQAIQARWESELDRLNRTPVDQALRRVFAAAAEDDSLRGLFPFTSMNRLCFSRCSDYPFTIDCPCIQATPTSYFVLATWTVGDHPAAVLLETADVEEAVAAVVANLPADRAVWIGSSGE